MAARRLVIVMLVLLGISTLAAALVPAPDGDRPDEQTASETQQEEQDAPRDQQQEPDDRSGCAEMSPSRCPPTRPSPAPTDDAPRSARASSTPASTERRWAEDHPRPARQPGQPRRHELTGGGRRHRPAGLRADRHRLRVRARPLRCRRRRGRPLRDPRQLRPGELVGTIIAARPSSNEPPSASPQGAAPDPSRSSGTQRPGQRERQDRQSSRSPAPVAASSRAVGRSEYTRSTTSCSGLKPSALSGSSANGSSPRSPTAVVWAIRS